MNARLSSADAGRLASVLHTLLSPLDYDDVQSWRLRLHELAIDAFGADQAFSVLPHPDVPYVAASSHTSIAHEYGDYLQDLERSYSVIRRTLALGAFHRRDIFAPWWDEIERSAYLNEYIPAIRGYDALSMTVPIGPNQEAGPQAIAQFTLHHTSPHARPFGEEGKTLMQLLYPAFRAGVHALFALHHYREQLARSIDALGLAALLCDADGQVLHQTPRLSALLGADPSGDTVRAAMVQLARSLPQPSSRPGAGADIDALARGAARSLTTARTPAGRYHLRCCQLASLFSVRGAVLVVLAPARQALPDVSVLAGRHDLTPQQARVALLLAQRKTNREIAAILHISPHTARHHVEAVLDKLGLSSRRDVEGTLAAHSGES